MLDKHQSVQVRAHSPIYLVVILVLFASAHAQQPDGKVQMVIPGVKGVLEINVGPTTSKVRVRPDGMETQMQAMDRPDHLAISAFLQRVKFPASPERCRSEWWSPTEKGLRSHGIELVGLRESMAEGIARVVFIVPEANGVKIKAKDVHAYLGSGELCAEVHLSKVMFEPQDQSLFEEVLASARLLPDALPKPAAG